MTDSRWELVIVVLLSSSAFFTAWHFVAPLLDQTHYYQ